MTLYATKKEVQEFVKYLERAELANSDIDRLCIGYIANRITEIDGDDLSKFMFALQSAIAHDLGY